MAFAPISFELTDCSEKRGKSEINGKSRFRECAAHSQPTISNLERNERREAERKTERKREKERESRRMSRSWVFALEKHVRTVDIWNSVARQPTALGYRSVLNNFAAGSLLMRSVFQLRWLQRRCRVSRMAIDIIRFLINVAKKKKRGFAESACLQLFSSFLLFPNVALLPFCFFSFNRVFAGCRTNHQRARR